MIVYLSIDQVLDMHRRQIDEFGGAHGLRDRGLLEAALARPQATFGGDDLYPDLAAKAAAILHSLVGNHPFVDGNKRIGAMATEIFLLANGATLIASDGEFEDLSFAGARGELVAEALAIWIRQRTRRPED